MLPAGKEVREVYLTQGGVLASAALGTLLIDASTVDVETARAVAAAAHVDEPGDGGRPVSGGVAGAEQGTLTFMVGASDAAFARAKPILEVMGKTIVHAGGPGAGQAVKICNNMILGVSMIAVSEAFVLAEKLGIDAQKLFDISSQASGQCWAMTSYCPVPGPVPASPANRDYQAGFTAAMMLKDLKLAQEAAKTAGTKAPMGAGRRRSTASMWSRATRERIFPASSNSCAALDVRPIGHKKPPRARRLLTRPLPSWERAAQTPQQTQWVRGAHRNALWTKRTPHPIETC